MRVLFAVLASASLVVTSGCSTIRDELRYPGGAPGRLLDERTFDASQSKHLALLRATVALAITARIGEASVATEDADVFARQLAEASNEINFAAVDAGFIYFDKKTGADAEDNEEGEDAEGLKTCSIRKGKLRDEKLTNFLGVKTYAEIDAECAGYFVNFEANLARIEARTIRAMLTALPADKARKFLEDLTKGDLLAALWSLTGSFSDLAAAFHRGAGVYRAGIENVAASTPGCDQSEPEGARFNHTYKQKRDTVLAAAACLGLSQEYLFDKEDIGANALPNQIDPRAFLALFRIARTSCVALPLINAPTEDDRFLEARKARRDACRFVEFNPKPRPDKITITEEPAVAPPPPPAPPVVPPVQPATPDQEQRLEELPAIPPPA